MPVTKATSDELQLVPWPTVAPAILSEMALYLTDSRNPFVILAGAICLLSLVTKSRLPGQGAIVLPLRLVIFGIVFAASAAWRSQMTENTGNLVIALDNVGVLCAFEIAIRLWRRTETARSDMSVILFFSGVVLLCACQDEAPDHALRFSPAFFLLVLVIYPLYRKRPDFILDSPGARFVVPIKIIFIALALGLGFGTAKCFLTYQQQISMLGENILNGTGTLASHTEVSGISKSPSLGFSFNMRGSTARMLTLKDYVGDPHLRGMSFDTYANRSWLPLMEQRNVRAVTGQRLNALASGPRCSVTRYTDDDGVVFYPLDAAGLDPLNSVTINRDLSNGGPITFNGPLPVQYDIALGTGSKSVQFFNQPPSAPEKERDLDVPDEIDPRVKLIAKNIGDHVNDPFGRINAVVNYLDKNNKYSLTTNPGRADPLSSFILQQKSADCEYFASATVILLRCLHVPTRFVIGYYAHEHDGPDTIVVRGQDAHAWAESWIPEKGWITVDATPGDGRPDETASPPSISVRWTEALQDVLAAVRNWLSNLSVSQLSSLVGGILVCIGVFVYVRSRFARLTRSYSSLFVISDPELSKLSVRFIAWLDSHQLPCSEAQTWQDHLGRALNARTSQSEQNFLSKALNFVKAYSVLRFGLGAYRDAQSGRRAAALVELRNQMDDLEAQPAWTSGTEEALQRPS